MAMIPTHPPTEDDPPAPFISPDLADLAARLDRIEAILRECLEAVRRVSGRPQS